MSMVSLALVGDRSDLNPPFTNSLIIICGLSPIIYVQICPILAGSVTNGSMLYSSRSPMWNNLHTVGQQLNHQSDSFFL